MEEVSQSELDYACCDWHQDLFTAACLLNPPACIQTSKEFDFIKD